MSLTILQIKHAKEGMHADGNGLYLRVQASGAKSWIFRFQLNGKRREMGLGTLDSRSLTEARTAATQLLMLVRAGIDPIVQREAQKAEAAAVAKSEAARAVTFDTAAAAYIAAHRAGWKNGKHALQWEATLATYASPVIGHKTVAEVSTEDLLLILNPIWKNKTETASRVRSRVELVLSYAKAMKWRQGENPAVWRGNLDALLPRPTKVKTLRHYPALPHLQVADFYAELKLHDGIGPRALQFLILTAARSGEVRLAQWNEFDLDRSLWRIPASRMKAGKEHCVPLSCQALRLIRSLPIVEDCDFVFPGSRDHKPLSDMTLSAILRRMNQDQIRWTDPRSGDPAVPHGFRSTFRDWAAEIGEYPRDLAEHALAHTLKDKVEAAYHRSTMLDRRVPMMQAWADYVDPLSVGNRLEKQ